jgi:hypothetical protein
MEAHLVHLCPTSAMQLHARHSTIGYSHRCVFFSIDDSIAALYASRYAAVSNPARLLWLARSRHTTDDTPVRPTSTPARRASLAGGLDRDKQRATVSRRDAISFGNSMNATCLNVTGQNRATRDAGRRSAWEPCDV